MARAAREESDEPRRRGGGRRALPPVRAARQPRSEPRRRGAGPRWASPALTPPGSGSRPRSRRRASCWSSTTSCRCTRPGSRIADAGLGVPEAPRGRAGPVLPAGVGRPGSRRALSFIGYRPRRVLRWSPGDPAIPTSWRRRRSASPGRRGCRACRRLPAAPSECSPTTWFAPSSRSAIPIRTRWGSQTWR